jgi:hypothetical protein
MDGQALPSPLFILCMSECMHNREASAVLRTNKYILTLVGPVRASSPLASHSLLISLITLNDKVK